MPDEDAYMALALNNAKGELHPLEEGMHAIGSGLDVKAYAERAGKAHTTVVDKVKAARVAEVVTHMRHELARFRTLRTIAESRSVDCGGVTQWIGILGQGEPA